MDFNMPSAEVVYDSAKGVWESTRKVHEDLVAALQAGDTEKMRMSRLLFDSSITPGLYRHWKSTAKDQKFYAVFGCGLQKDKNTAFVSYTSLYGDQAGKLVFLDLLDEESGFLSPVWRPNGPPFPYMGQRFRQIMLLTGAETVRLAEQATYIAKACPTEEKLMLHLQHDF